MLKTDRGIVYFVGAGPAGRDLITVRGLELLRLADVVIYDYLVARDILAETRPDAQLICCDSLGKRPKGVDQGSQKKINALLCAHARKGKTVVRLKNGDPFIFGRASEEMKALKNARIPFEVIPGVTAAQAAAASAGVSLTDREGSSSVVFVTGHEASDKHESSIDWKSIAGCGTVVVYMGVGNIAAVVQALIEAGRSKRTSVIVVSCAGRPDQIMAQATLGTIVSVVQKKKIAAPAVFIIGNTTGLPDQWRGRVSRRHVLDTGLVKTCFNETGCVIHQPLVRILPLENYKLLDRAIQGVEDFQWILFTSRYAVRSFWERFRQLGMDVRRLYCLKIAVIGKVTAEELRSVGIKADVVAQVESTKGLVETFRKIGLSGARVLYPHSDIAGKDGQGLARELTALGALVRSVPAYRNVPREDLPDMDIGLFNEIYFASPSGVMVFVDRYGCPRKKTRIHCIGAITLAAAKKVFGCGYEYKIRDH